MAKRKAVAPIGPTVGTLASPDAVSRAVKTSALAAQIAALRKAHQEKPIDDEEDDDDDEPADLMTLFRCGRER